MKINPLIKSSIIYVIATVIGQGMSFLGIIIFTRLMSQEAYGQYSTYYAYVSTFTVLIGANLYYSLNNAYIDKKKEINQYRKSVLTLSAIIAAIVLVFCWIFYSWILKRDSVFIVFVMALHSYSFFVVNYRIYSANMENDYKKKQRLLILPNILQLVGALIFVLLVPSNSYQARVVGSTLGVFLVAVVVFYEMYKVRGRLINTEHWRYALAISLPSIIMSLSYMLMQQCDKVMISDICGAKDAAVYSVIYYMGYVIIVVMQAVNPVRQSWIYGKLDKNELIGIQDLQKWYLIIMAVMATGVLMIGPEAMKIIAPSSYWQFQYIAPFVASACAMMLYAFYTEILLFFKRNISLSVCVLVCAVVNIVLNAIIIPQVGALAAAYTTVVSYLLLFILTAIITSRDASGVYSGKQFIAFIAFIALDIGIYYLTYSRIIVRYVIYLTVLIAILIFVIKKKEEWKKFLAVNRN